MAISEDLLINPLPGLYKSFLKVFKIDLASCFTIWFSARAPTLHPPDLLDIPSDLIAFHKSLGLTLHSLTLFSKNYFLLFAMRFCIQYPALLLIALSTISLVFLYFLKCLSWIIIFFWNLTIKPFLRNPFDSFAFDWRYFVSDLH